MGVGGEKKMTGKIGQIEVTEAVFFTEVETLNVYQNTHTLTSHSLS